MLAAALRAQCVNLSCCCCCCCSITETTLPFLYHLLGAGAGLGSGELAVPVFLYAAAESSQRTLADIRRMCGYFKGSKQGKHLTTSRASIFTQPTSALPDGHDFKPGSMPHPKKRPCMQMIIISDLHGGSLQGCSVAARRSAYQQGCSQTLGRPRWIPARASPQWGPCPLS